MKHIAIFASGSGSNAENISKHFAYHSIFKVTLIVTNNPDSYVIKRANALKIPFEVITQKDLNTKDIITSILKSYHIEFIVLAGFLLKIPSFMVETFPNRIINIHPALLPKYGGKGMYGMNVHKAVIEHKEIESGISIHFVNEHYDAGTIIAQYKCSIDKNETPESLAQKVHSLEYAHYPKVIEEVFSNN